MHVRFSDHPKQYRIVVEDEASLCLADLGFEVDVTLCSDREALYRTYLGNQSLTQACRLGQIELVGRRDAVRALVAAFHPSPVAELVAAGSG